MSAIDMAVELGTVDQFFGPYISDPHRSWNKYWNNRGPGVARGWHDADPLPPPMLMPDLCPSLKGSGLTLAHVTQAIYEVHAILKAAGPDYDGEDVRRAMILNRLEARLHEARPEVSVS